MLVRTIGRKVSMLCPPTPLFWSCYPVSCHGVKCFRNTPVHFSGSLYPFQLQTHSYDMVYLLGLLWYSFVNRMMMRLWLFLPRGNQLKINSCRGAGGLLGSWLYIYAHLVYFVWFVWLVYLVRHDICHMHHMQRMCKIISPRLTFIF